MMEARLSICTVNYNSADFVLLNQCVVERLNPGELVKWVVAENSPAGSPLRLDPEQVVGSLVPGVPAEHIPIYHHTLALKKCTDSCDTRFVLVIDPDLYVVLDNWIDSLIRYMMVNDLAIFTIPWHPKSGSKYRYFPAVHFALFDTARFPLAEIDFRPDYPDGNDDPQWPYGWRKDAEYFVTSPLAKLLGKIPLLRARKRFYTDTGSRFYKKYVSNDLLRFELATPVFDYGAALAKFSKLGALLETVLPDELCYLPKRYRKSRIPPFLEKLSSQPVPIDWEEFSWDGRPFAFHVRGNRQRAERDRAKEIALVKELLESALPSQES